MEYDKIKKLMDDMGNSKLTSIDIDFPDGTKISMKKDAIQEKIVVAETTTDIVKEEKEKTPEISKPSGNIVKSPMVGTFYLKPSPTSEPYVEIGKTVQKGDTLCIIEAMKLMNEIEAEFDGEVVEVCLNDGDAVEYGKPLFKLK